MNDNENTTEPSVESTTITLANKEWIGVTTAIQAAYSVSQNPSFIVLNNEIVSKLMTNNHDAWGGMVRTAGEVSEEFFAATGLPRPGE